MFSDEDGATLFLVLVNDEGQYSLWPQKKSIPDGWREAGSSGDKAECLSFIEHAWTDMRPKSLRESMENGVAS